MKQAKWFLLLHVILGVYAGSSVCSKLAARQPFLSAAFILLYGLMLAALVVYAVGWQQVIKHLPLTTAYANKAVTVVWGILLGLSLIHICRAAAQDPKTSLIYVDLYKNAHFFV